MSAFHNCCGFDWWCAAEFLLVTSPLWAVKYTSEDIGRIILPRVGDICTIVLVAENGNGTYIQGSCDTLSIVTNEWEEVCEAIVRGGFTCF